MGGHKGSQETGPYQADNTCGKDLAEEDGHGLKGYHRITHGHSSRGEENAAEDAVFKEIDKGAYPEKLRNGKAYEKPDRGPDIEFFDHGRAFRGACLHDGGLPHRASDDSCRKDHPDHIRRAEVSAVMKGIETGITVDGPHRFNDIVPPQFVDRYPTGQDFSK